MVRSSIAQRVGERLRALRVEADLTQTQLGDRAGGIAAAEISKFENARRSPSLETLERLSVAMGVPLRDLIDVDLRSPEQIELDAVLARLRGRPPEQVRRAVAVLGALLGAE
ncbi:MAG: helix-turn-helix transcriptional regulator [Alphaproteobacteria bacterium]|nr:helix-turn-helix transcriptional regulator [Alphaproteobacteria bacterium]